MMRTTLYALGLLALAVALQIAILPQFTLLPPKWLGQLLDGRSLLPLVGILFGLLRGEIQGMILALAAACLFGFSQPPGQLGLSIDSFVLVAFLAGLISRLILIQGAVTRCFFIIMLLLLERVEWWIMRQSFLRGTGSMYDTSAMHISWPALLLTALLGSYLYKWLAPKIRLKFFYDS